MGGVRRWSLLTVAVIIDLALSTASRANTETVSVGAAYTADSFASVTGGRKTGFRQMGLLEVSAEGEFAAIGLQEVTAFVNVQFAHGRSLSHDLIGDAQVHSNIDAPDGVRLFEAWLRIPVSAKATAKVGLIDLNGEFDVQTSGALFLNSSHGIGADFSQSGRNGPSIFPITATAAVLSWTDERWSARIGLFDAVAGRRDNPRRTAIRFPGSSGLLVVAEGDVALTPAVELQVGAWHYTTRFDRLEQTAGGSAQRSRGNRGGYAMVEAGLGTFGGLPMTGWVRVGTAATHINPIGLYTGGGITIGKEGNRTGLAIASARLGRPARAVSPTMPTSRETAFELTHEHQVSDRLIVQPDLQYIINPGWDPTLDDAVVAGVRLVFTL